MKNKLFLTSMFAVMLAFPAYAYQVGGGDSLPHTANCPNGTDLCGEISTSDSTVPCDQNPLTFNTNTHESYGTYTLTAQWSPKQYSVTYAPGTGCTGGNTDSNVSYGSSYTVKNSYSDAGISAQSGYSLPASVTWSGDWINGTSSAAGTSGSSTYTPGQITYFVPGSLTLTSSDCVPNNYTVTYDCTTNGGSLIGTGWTSTTTGSDQVVFNTTNYTLRTPGSTCQAPTGSTTSSTWSCHKTGDTSVDVTTPVAQPWNLPYNVTCVASYGVDSYNITYKCGTYDTNQTTVTGNDSVVSYNYGSSWTLRAEANGCTAPTGWHFAGWQCGHNPGAANSSTYQVPAIMTTSGDWAGKWAAIQENSGSYSQYTGTYNYAGDIDCYAQWEENEVNLKYLKEDGDTTPYSTDQCQYGADTFDLPANPTKTGYTFTGWKVTSWSGTSNN